jgi:hypothetical protein
MPTARYTPTMFFHHLPDLPLLPSLTHLNRNLVTRLPGFLKICVSAIVLSESNKLLFQNRRSNHNRPIKLVQKLQIPAG